MTETTCGALYAREGGQQSWLLLPEQTKLKRRGIDILWHKKPTNEFLLSVHFPDEELPSAVCSNLVGTLVLK